MRGRGNRKGPNPLARNYESNGPDVKIRGNAQHVAEKYTALARDAQAAGDRVMAENYLQHAEHYNRIILAAQAQAAPQFQRDEGYRDDVYADDGDDADGYDNEPRLPKLHNSYQHAPVNGSGPQPDIEGTPAEVALGEDAVHARANGAASAEKAGEKAGSEPSETTAAGSTEEAGQSRRPRRAPRGRRTSRPASEGAGEEGTAPGNDTESVAASAPGD